MKDKPSIGLLPLYLKLYDDRQPELRQQFDTFLKTVVAGLESHGIEIHTADVCRLAPEIDAALDAFGREQVDLVVTVHLAYSPSLEAADALTATEVPLLLLDVTMDYDFGFNVDPARLMFNHGIHGVQDLASVLRRRGKPFHVVAGHVTDPTVLRRAADIVRAAWGAQRLHATRALRIGETFRGMGDFAVSDVLLYDALGISVDEIDCQRLEAAVGSVDPQQIDDEIAADHERFAVEASLEVHRRSVKVGLGLRQLLAQGNYDAFSMNFLAFDSAEGPVDTVPFLEASKAMGRGIGYAGEGDVLTAALVGSLSRAFGRTTFTEIFCPDWAGQALFLSHMGEINPDVAAAKPRLYEKPFPFTNANNPAIAVCAIAPGPATLVNLAPGPDDRFQLLAAPVEVLQDATHPGWRDWVRAWIRPPGTVESFLEQYSSLGGTHHSALILGHRMGAVRAYAQFAGLPFAAIE